MAALNKALQEHFELVNGQELPKKGVYGLFGEVDFSILTAEQANTLTIFGFPYLRRKTPTLSDSPMPKRKKK